MSCFFFSTFELCNRTFTLTEYLFASVIGFSPLHSSLYSVYGQQDLLLPSSVCIHGICPYIFLPFCFRTAFAFAVLRLHGAVEEIVRTTSVTRFVLFWFVLVVRCCLCPDISWWEVASLFTSVALVSTSAPMHILSCGVILVSLWCVLYACVCTSHRSAILLMDRDWVMVVATHVSIHCVRAPFLLLRLLVGLCSMYINKYIYI